MHAASPIIRRESPRQPDVLELLRQSDEFTLALYPPESAYLLNVDELEHPGVDVFVARIGGAALGIAALVPRDDGTAEIKRMFVASDARGRGLAGEILRSIESHATTRGIQTLRLETGPLSHAAIVVYERHGYARIPNFGQYIGDEFSICYEKPLSPLPPR